MNIPGRKMTQVVVAVLLLGAVGARAGAAEPARHPPPGSVQPDAPVASPGAATAATPSAAAPAPPRIDTADITKRANKDAGVDIEATIAGWQHELDRVEAELRHPNLHYSELNALRDNLQQVRSSVEAVSAHVASPLSAAKSQMESLGPGPASGQPPEPDQIARNRAELGYYLSLLSAAQVAVNAAQLRIDQLSNGVQEVRRKNFSLYLFQPVPGVYAPETWTQLPSQAPAAMRAIGDLVIGWWTDISDRGEIARIAIEAIILALALMALAWRGVRRLRRWRGDGEPPFWRRASSAAGVILLRAAPGIAPILLLYRLTAQAQSLPERVDWLFYALAQSAIIIFAVGALVATVLAPAAPQWRLLPASNRAAFRLCGLIVLLALAYGLTNLIYIASRLIQAPLALTVAVAVPSCLLLAAITVAILLTPLEAPDQGGVASPKWLRVLRVPIWAVIVAIFASTMAGYVALARFLAQQLVVTGAVLALIYLLLLWVDGLMQGLGDDDAMSGRLLRDRAGLDRQRRERLALPFGLMLKFAVLVLSVPLIMLQWGYDWPDIYDWYRELFFDLHIGNTQVSFAALLASVIVFVLGYGAARWFQSWLDARVLQPAGISGGVRDSIRTGVGYVGVMVAAVVAFSYAGFNLSSLTIVAGALSVGIGLGLQGVINNFVSGLILLAERPIKVGDIVVVGGEEGTVRKISVRSTEIETADRAHVLVPNSYFITEKVKNWTHRNSFGRVVIGVNVDSNSDPRETRDLLLKLASDNPNVMTTPGPSVDFEEFGADSLNFKLYATTYDLAKNMSVRTDLRIAILDAFKQAGIRIAFLQTDVTVRSIERLREAVSEYVPPASNGRGDGHQAPRRIGETGG